MSAILDNYPALRVKPLSDTIKQYPAPDFLGLQTFKARKSVIGTLATYDEVKLSRAADTGLFVDFDSASRNVALRGIARKQFDMAKVFVDKALPQSILNDLAKLGTYDADGLAELMADEMADLNTIIDYAQELLIWQALQGNINISETSPVYTKAIDFGVAVSHKPTVTASWATNSTDIVSDIAAWKKLIQTDSNVKAKRAFLNSSTMRYIINNDAVLATLSEIQKNEISQTQSLSKFAGLDFVVYDGAANTTGTTYIPDNTFILATDSKDLVKTIEGSEVISTDQKTVHRVKGKFAYPEITTNPTSLKIRAGLNFLPVLTRPDEVVVAKVKI